MKLIATRPINVSWIEAVGTKGYRLIASILPEFANGDRDAQEAMAKEIVRRWNILEGLPAVKPRRPYEDHEPDGYMESDRDYVLNNLDLAVQLLDRLSAKEPA